MARDPSQGHVSMMILRCSKHHQKSEDQATDCRGDHCSFTSMVKTEHQHFRPLMGGHKNLLRPPDKRTCHHNHAWKTYPCHISEDQAHLCETFV